jgi:predicted ATPase
VRQTNLPAVLTPLIGREQELEAGHQQILNPKTRLLTLIGPPGIGKTRLALQVASNAVEHFDDGIFFVDLSPVSDPDSVLPTIGRALGLKEAGERPIEELLLDFARDKRALLVLDNFEQVLDAAPLVVKLMESGPWLKAVVTSREALHVRGERHLSVPALNVPDMNRLPPVESLLNYSAVELFAERAVEVAPGFVLTDKNAEDVAQVCVALEGLPLAIELAAARLRHLSPRVLRAELSSRLKLLTGGRRDLPPRQRTLFSAIEWSYDLLSEKEQDLFAKLGVFSGGFTASAVYAVCGAKSERDVPAVQEILFSLVDKSIVKEANSDAVTGDMRFGMLEVIREFAVERLEERGEIEEARQRHALYFMALAEESEVPLSGADQIPWLNRLEAEYDNLLAALRWSVLRDPEVGLRLAGALKHFWWIRGNFSEGRTWLAAALEAYPTPASTLSARESPEIAVAQDYRAKALYGVGALASEQGDFELARLAYNECLTIARALGHRRSIAVSLGALGDLAINQGDFARALPLLEESLAIRRELGDKWGIAVMFSSLGLIAHMQGDYATARSYHEESLIIWQELGEKFRIAESLDHLGIVSLAEGDYAKARPLLEESLTIRRQLGHKWGIATSLGHLASLAHVEGDHTLARRLYEESLIIQRDIGNKTGFASVLCELAEVATTTGDATRGAKLLGIVAGLCEGIKVPLDAESRAVYERSLDSAKEQLGDEAFDKACADGRTMPIEEAVDYALGNG